MTAPVRNEVKTRASVEQVFAVLTSDAWVQRRAERFSDGSTVVRREDRPDGGVLLAVSRELPAGAPGFLARLLPKDGRVVQTDDWQPPDPTGGRSGTWEVEFAGAPARLGGTMRIEPQEAGAAYVVEGEATVSVPLVGGRAEAFVVDMVGRLGRKEGELLQEVVGG